MLRFHADTKHLVGGLFINLTPGARQTLRKNGGRATQLKDKKSIKLDSEIITKVVVHMSAKMLEKSCIKTLYFRS